MVKAIGRRAGGRNVDRIHVNDPSNLENVGYTFYGDDEAPFAVRGGMAVQMGDDSASAGSTGYAAAIQYLTESGNRIATSAADEVHNHWGVYTADGALSGADNQPAKRLSIEGGSTTVGVNWYQVNQMAMETQAAGENLSLRLIPEAGDDAGLNIYQGTGNLAFSAKYDASRDSVRLQNYAASTPDFVELNPDGTLDFHDHHLDGLTRLSFSQATNRVDATQIEQRGSDSEGNAAYRIMAGGTDDNAGLSLYNDADGAGPTIRGAVNYDASRGAVRIQNYDASTADFFELNADGTADHHGHESTNVVWENGTTGSRPASPATGQRYFDTTLGQPVWYDGANWVDAQGTTV